MGDSPKNYSLFGKKEKKELYKKCRDFKMENHDEIRIEDIKSEENIGEINLLDGENIKIELLSHEEIMTEIDQNQINLEGQGSKRAFCFTGIASESHGNRFFHFGSAISS